MAFFWKKDFSAFNGYSILAGHGIPFAATFASEFVKFSPKSEGAAEEVFREALAFATAVQGMKLQSEYKIRADSEMQSFFKQLLRVYEDIANGPSNSGNAALQAFVSATLDPEFVQLFSIYGRREFAAFGSEHEFRNFVQSTGRSWGMVQGTSTVLATVMLQYRLTAILARSGIEHSSLNGVLMFSQIAADAFAKDCFRGAMD